MLLKSQNIFLYIYLDIKLSEFLFYIIAYICICICFILDISCILQRFATRKAQKCAKWAQNNSLENKLQYFFFFFTPINFYLKNTNTVFSIFYLFISFTPFSRDHEIILHWTRNIGLIAAGTMWVSAVVCNEVHGIRCTSFLSRSAHWEMIPKPCLAPSDHPRGVLAQAQ